MDKEIKNFDDEKLEYQSLDNIMSDRFGKYSKYIIQQRALPDIRDGLKPVQRRILFSMDGLNLFFDKPFKKSARVVGDVIGKYHPHGDTSIYEALVRMSQNWKMNIPLVIMHGNNGSIDDDPAAAMRYTEVKLAKITNLMLEELNKKNVKFIPNFDDTEIEPLVLPSYIPNLLLNGAKGIAAGFATEIPPHNLGELIDAIIAKIKNPLITNDELIKYIKGPDFPTGGIVYNQNGIKKAFNTGSGKITISSKYEIINENKNVVIKIKEIPYGVIKSKLVRQIDEFRINGQLNGIKEVIDESDRYGISIAIILEPNTNVQAILNYLLQKSEMQIYYSYNMISIVNNAPKILGINDMLNQYLFFVKDIKRKSILFDFDKYLIRLEIVKGFIKVSNIPDEVIKVIRETVGTKNNVINNLVNFLGFTKVQATAIAELRLYRLSKTDAQEFIKEKNELEEKIAYFQLLLDNENEFNKYLIKIFNDIKKEYATERKTIISTQEQEIVLKKEDLIKNENCWISVSKDGYLKRFTNRIYESNNLNSYGIKENDKIILFKKSLMLNKIIVFTNFGNCLSLYNYKIKESKWRDEGIHISDFSNLEKEEKIIAAFDVEDFKSKSYFVFITKFGIGKKCLLNDFEQLREAKFQKCINFKKPFDELIDVKIAKNEDEQILICTNTGHINLIKLDFVPQVSIKAAGNALIKVEHNYVSSFGITTNDQLVLINHKNEFLFFNLSQIKDTFSLSKLIRGVKIFDCSNPKSIINIIYSPLKYKLLGNKNNYLEQIEISLKDDSKNVFKKIKTNENNLVLSAYCIDEIK